MNAKQVLIRGVNWLGDAVMSTPALRRLREALPQARITLLTPVKLADLWRLHPALNSVLTFAPQDTVWKVARRLNREQFDLALVLPNSLRSALEVWLAGIPQRVGYAGQARGLFFTQPIQRQPGIARMRKRTIGEIQQLIRQSEPLTSPAPDFSGHHLHHYLHLAAALGADAKPVPPQLVVSTEEVQAVLNRFGIEPQHRPARPLFGLNPGAEYGPAKRWLEDRFIATAIELRQRADCRWIILGGQNDRELAGRIAAAIASACPARPTEVSGPTPGHVWNLAGATTLRELCAALSACRAVLTNDTGPMHVAAALGTPVVATFGSTAPELTGPGLPGDPRHHLLRAAARCAPCFLRACPIDFRCMKSISVAQAVAALLKHL